MSSLFNPAIFQVWLIDGEDIFRFGLTVAGKAGDPMLTYLSAICTPDLGLVGTGYADGSVVLRILESGLEPDVTLNGKLNAGHTHPIQFISNCPGADSHFVTGDVIGFVNCWQLFFDMDDAALASPELDRSMSSVAAIPGGGMKF
jgi:hypothetical protein